MAEFRGFPKIPRLRREILITEKIDGTNGCVVVDENGDVTAQSRNRAITPAADNAGFAKWVEQNKTVLAEGLGAGYHFGEWWGVGIQRGYGLRERRFSLFNVTRWEDALTMELIDVGVDTVPALLSGPMSDDTIESALNILREEGSIAAPGYMKPEGIVVFHKQSGHLYKVLLENDDMAKGIAA